MTKSPDFKWVLRCALMGAVLFGAACSREEAPQLFFLGGSVDGPDEFAILPAKPLEEPEDYASLPAPTPGGSNLTDPTPEADLVAALGGNPVRLTGGGVDAGLLGYVGRFGVSSTIRSQLAIEDEQFRKENRGLPLERLFRQTVYFDAYSVQSLDQYRELERLRAAGIPTPTVPPALLGF
ncbi:MAG: DUF3035 domain-containing protein [Pseudomonadota bacterium]